MKRDKTLSLSAEDSSPLKVFGYIKGCEVDASGVVIKSDFVVIESDFKLSYKVLLGRPWLKKVNAKTSWDAEIINIFNKKMKAKIKMNNEDSVSSITELNNAKRLIKVDEYSHYDSYDDSDDDSSSIGTSSCHIIQVQKPNALKHKFRFTRWIHIKKM